jgi:hypothetical protein
VYLFLKLKITQNIDENLTMLNLSELIVLAHYTDQPMADYKFVRDIKIFSFINGYIGTHIHTKVPA